ncbi:hypothetical protein Cus16_2887 [Curtobacterium sp. ER1/6]|nr:hypothetical protein Cus16_2887 [Curtobacterium sp. ER1/6]
MQRRPSHAVRVGRDVAVGGVEVGVPGPLPAPQVVRRALDRDGAVGDLVLVDGEGGGRVERHDEVLRRGVPGAQVRVRTDGERRADAGPVDDRVRHADAVLDELVVHAGLERERPAVLRVDRRLLHDARPGLLDHAVGREAEQAVRGVAVLRLGHVELLALPVELPHGTGDAVRPRHEDDAVRAGRERRDGERLGQVEAGDPELPDARGDLGDDGLDDTVRSGVTEVVLPSGGCCCGHAVLSFRGASSSCPPSATTTSTPAARIGATASAVTPAVTTTSMSSSGRTRPRCARPNFEPSATTTVRPAVAASIRFASVSGRFTLVSPCSTSSPVPLMNARSAAIAGRTAPMNGATRECWSGRRVPPVTTTVKRGTAGSRASAVVSELVTTVTSVRSSRATRADATAAGVVPTSSTTHCPERTRSAAARPIAALATWCSTAVSSSGRSPEPAPRRTAPPRTRRMRASCPSVARSCRTVTSLVPSAAASAAVRTRPGAPSTMDTIRSCRRGAGSEPARKRSSSRTGRVSRTCGGFRNASRTR